MDDEFKYALVDRALARSLSLKRRSAGLSVLDVLHRKLNSRVAAMLLAGLLDSDNGSDSDSNSDSDGDDDEIDRPAEKDDILEIVSYVFLKEVAKIDRPLRISMSKVVKKEISLDLYSDEECWSMLRFRKPDITRMIDLLEMPLSLLNLYFLLNLLHLSHVYFY